jgi:glycerophosphoryl diester phosphodiesterase
MWSGDSAVASGTGGGAVGGPDPDVIAHRGFAGVHPENTLEAVRGAIGEGSVTAAPIVEVDVMPSAEGTPVVFHDTTLDRLTEEADAVWETPLAELRSLEILDSGQSIPLLEEVFETVPTSVALNVEVKHPGVDPGPVGLLSPQALERRREEWRPFVERVLGIAGRHGHEILVSSFFEGALGAVRDVDPDVPLAAVFFDSIEDGFTVADRHDTEAVHAPRNMILGTSLFNERYVSGPFDPIDVVERAHDVGRAVNVWTVETTTQAAAFEGTGVDGLITDVPLDAGGR